MYSRGWLIIALLGYHETMKVILLILLELKYFPQTSYLLLHQVCRYGDIV